MFLFRCSPYLFSTYRTFSLFTFKSYINVCMTPVCLRGGGRIEQTYWNHCDFDGHYGTVSLRSFFQRLRRHLRCVASPEFDPVIQLERCRIIGDTYYPHAKMIRDSEIYSCIYNRTEFKCNQIQKYSILR